MVLFGCMRLRIRIRIVLYYLSKLSRGHQARTTLWYVNNVWTLFLSRLLLILTTNIKYIIYIYYIIHRDTIILVTILTSYAWGKLNTQASILASALWLVSAEMGQCDRIMCGSINTAVAFSTVACL